MSSILDKNAGMFNPALRFAFTNITDEDFVSAWGGNPIVVKPRQTVELPHYLAEKLTNELVDKIMIGEAKLDEVAVNQPYYRSPKGTSLGVPEARKVWEDQIVRQLQVDEESPEIQIMRTQIKAELLADMAREPAGSVNEAVGQVVAGLSEFAALKEPQQTEAKAKKPIKLKTIE